MEQLKSESQRKIALFGGSFDPVTTAHCAIVQNLAKIFDKVIVLPCYLSPFKLDADIELADKRVKMLKMVFEGLENVKVSKWEVNNEHCSYSYLTVNHFVEKYPADELYFVVGSDGLEKLPQWENAMTLATKTKFYVVPRPNFTIEPSVLAELRAKGFNITVAPFCGEEGSSSEARVSIPFSKLAEVVPQEVANYILKRGLYNDYQYIYDAYAVFGLKEERIQHTYRACKMAITLAKIHDVSVSSAIIAMLMHDIGKYASEETLAREGVKIPQEVYLMPEPIRHAPISAAIAAQYFKVENADIINAIATHTCGASGMSKLQMVVYLADSVEDGRAFPLLASLQNTARKSLEQGMLECLKNTIDYVASSGEVYYKTIEAYKYYEQITQSVRLSLKEQSMKKEEKTNVNVESVSGLVAEDAVKAPVKPKAAKAKTIKQEVMAEAETQKPAAAKKAEPQDVLNSPKELAHVIAKVLDDKKGKDIMIIDLGGKTIIADYFVIASVNSTPAVKALCDYVDDKLSKDFSIEPLRRDIDPKWAAIDYGSVILHVFHEDAREFYKLEKLWVNEENTEYFGSSDSAEIVK